MELIENYVNSRDFYSQTNYFILVVLNEFTVFIFQGKNRNWRLIRKMLATIGKKETPTITGWFRVQAKGVGYQKKNFKVKWYTQFYKNYLFHSVLYNFDDTIFDGRLGEALSDGCIRLSEVDAKFIYDHVPYNTLVLIIPTL